MYNQQLRKSHLDPPSRVGLIHNGMSSIYNGRSSISKNLCSKSTHKSIKTQLIEHRIEWNAILYCKKVDFLFYILCNLGKFKRNYEYNLNLI